MTTALDYLESALTCLRAANDMVPLGKNGPALRNAVHDIREAMKLIANGSDPVEVHRPQPVMSLRDQFAAAALTGLMMNSACDFTRDELAEDAFKTADEMLKAREKK